MLGSTIAGYRLTQSLGRGAFGEVFRGEGGPHGAVAVKLLHSELAASATVFGRFLNEARAAQAIDHPGVVRAYEFGQLSDGRAYIIMELLSGSSLARHAALQGGGPPSLSVVRLCGQIAGTLAAVHARGIVHRDLKPDNVMVVADEALPGGLRTKLLDFGIVKLSEARFGTMAAMVRTQANAAMGTPSYMPPELWQGAGAATGKADVYALGVVMYELLAGMTPFQGENLYDLALKHVAEAPPPLVARDRMIPSLLPKLIERMLAKEPAARPDMSEVVSDLDAAEDLLVPASAAHATLRDGLGELAGTVVCGRYRIEREIGVGSAGRVYLAEQAGLGRKVAIKVLRSDLSSDPAQVERFFREARTVNAVGDPGVVQVTDTGHLETGQAFLIMEHVNGDPLRRRLERAPSGLPLDDATRLGARIARVMARVHEKGIVHRDLKPDNLMVLGEDEDAQVKVLDFGIAKLAQEHLALGAGKLTVDASALLGTPAYMAPEQGKEAGEVTAAADVYSLGAILYEMVVGRPPFVGRNVFHIVHQHMNEMPPRLADQVSGVPAELSSLVARMLAKQERERPTMVEVAASLKRMTVHSGGTAMVPTSSGGRSDARPVQSPTLVANRPGAGATFERTKSRQLWPWVMGMLVAMVAALGCVLLWSLLRRSSSPSDAVLSAPAAVSTPTGAASPTAVRHGTTPPAKAPAHHAEGFEEAPASAVPVSEKRPFSHGAARGR